MLYIGNLNANERKSAGLTLNVNLSKITQK